MTGYSPSQLFDKLGYIVFRVTLNFNCVFPEPCTPTSLPNWLVIIYPVYTKELLAMQKFGRNLEPTLYITFILQLVLIILIYINDIVEMAYFNIKLY